MSVTPTSAKGTAIAALKTMISESANFQSHVGAASAAEALSFIRLYGIREVESGRFPRPCVLIEEESHGWESYSGGDRNHSLAKGVFIVTFLMDNPFTDPAAMDDTITAVENFAATTIDQVMELAGAAGYLNVHDPTMSMPVAPVASVPDNLDVWATKYAIPWGGQ